MRRAGDLLLRLFGFGGAAPKTALGRAARRLNQLVVFLVVVWVGVHLFPQVLFPKRFSAEAVTIHARAALPPAMADRIREATALLRRSELAVPGRPEHIFICNSRVLFTLLAPTSFRSFAFQMPWSGNIFVADADVALNLSHSSAATYNTRTFSGVIAHEMTHELIVHHLGLWRAVRLPSWIAEGYCDYVATESSFPEAQGMQLLARGEEDPSPSFKYFLYRKMVAHLLETKGFSFDELVAHGADAAVVRAETIAALRSGR